MKICKICNKEIIDTTRWVYCSEECITHSRKIANNIYKVVKKQKHLEEKKNWKYEELEIEKVKHNKKIPINDLGLTNSISTHLKLLLRENNLSKKQYVKMKRVDGIIKDFLVVVVTPIIIKKLFDKRYEIYKQNFRMDSLKLVKILAKIFELVNNYDFKKDKDESL